MKRIRFLPVGVFLVCIGLLAGITALAAPASQSLPGDTYRGVLSALWIDYEDGRPTAPQFFLHTAVDQTYLLEPGQVTEAELTALLRQEVVVTARETAATQSTISGETYPLLVVRAIWPQETAVTTLGLAAEAAINGNTSWVSIGCKFPDRLDEQRPMSYFAGMYIDEFPGLNHYWREVSNDHINLDGSEAYGWYILPKPYASYFDSAGNFNLYLFKTDCLAAADADIYYPDYYGFNLIVNGDGLAFAWGGTGTLIELDGVTRQWATTWMTQWSHRYISVFEHEMGHGYGLPHSYINQGTDPYDNHWDVMSKDRFNCPRFSDPVYGCYGQHTLAANKAGLGWIEPDRIFVAGQGTHTVTLERSALPSPTGYLMVKIPIAGSTTHYFTLETRQWVGYDDKLFGEAVVIHEVGGTPRTISLVAPTTIGDGSMWSTGEIFHHAEAGISVRVVEATHSGFVVTVRNGLSPAVTVLEPSDDTYISKYTPGTNFGLESVLLAGPKEADGQINTRTMLKFDRMLVPESVYKITLRLAVIDDVGVADPNYVAWTPPTTSSGEWTETELTWDNRSNVLVGWLAPDRNGEWLEWDVTYYVNYYGSPTFAVAIGDAPRVATYSSKEGPNPPQLVIDYLVAPGGATATPTAGPSPTPTFTPTPGLPPPVIKNIDNADGDGNFVVEWSPVAGIDGYRLREGVDGADDSVIYAGTEPRLARSNLAKGQYCYRVRAIIEGGEWGPYSEIKCTTVSRESSTPTSTPTAQGLAAPMLNDIPNADGDGDFVVSWSAVSGAEEYRLREGINGAEDAVVYAGPLRSFGRSSLANGEYCYRVRAIVVNGEWGPYSETNCVTVNTSVITPTITTTPTPEPAFKIALPVVIGQRP